MKLYRCSLTINGLVFQDDHCVLDQPVKKSTPMVVEQVGES